MFDLEKAASLVSDAIHGRDTGAANALARMIEDAAYLEAKKSVLSRNAMQSTEVYIGGYDWFTTHADELESTELYQKFYEYQSMMYSQALAMAAIRQRHWSGWTK
jgi:hypothetical protein